MLKAQTWVSLQLCSLAVLGCASPASLPALEATPSSGVSDLLSPAGVGLGSPAPPGPAPDTDDPSSLTQSWKNFFAVCWHNGPDQHVKYAKQMGYDSIGINSLAVPEHYQWVASRSDLKFYLVNPQWNIQNVNKGYLPSLPLGRVSTADERAFFNDFMAWTNTSSFPMNLARGWFDGSPNAPYSMFDFQQQRVINHVVDSIILTAQSFEDANIRFMFAGVIFDGPMLTGPEKDSALLHHGITHEYATYSDGYAAFIKQLGFRLRNAFPDAKVIHAPAQLYDRTEPGNRVIAAKAALSGAWYNWVGRMGALGADGDTIESVAPRLKLIRALPNWDNLSGVPLADRSWNQGVYQSPRSFASADVIYSRHWKTGKLFAVFNTHQGVIAFKEGEVVERVERVDSYFGEAGDGAQDVLISGTQLRLSHAVPIPLDVKSATPGGVGYIITLGTKAPVGSPLHSSRVCSLARPGAGELGAARCR